MKYLFLLPIIALFLILIGVFGPRFLIGVGLSLDLIYAALVLASDVKYED